MFGSALALCSSVGVVVGVVGPWESGAIELHITYVPGFWSWKGFNSTVRMLILCLGLYSGLDVRDMRQLKCL